MPRKKQPTADQIILGSKLSLNDWLQLMGTNKWNLVVPNNCFSSDSHKKEYLQRIHEFAEGQWRHVARCFLNKSANYGATSDYFSSVIDRHGRKLLDDNELISEFDRRSVPRHGPQWEGITWALDLLPHNPQGSISAIRSYASAHLQHFTDNMIFGHEDVVAMIQARYHVVARFSCFISYGRPDEAFAQRLYNSLVDAGIQVFFFPRNAIPGKKLHKLMREGVNQYDRIILICSKESLNRPGVCNELSETLQREAREGGKDYLIPIRLDDYVFTDWAPDDPNLVQAVRDRVVADFTGTADNDVKFRTAFSRLLSALNRPLVP